jgi:hypothetical protein
MRDRGVVPHILNSSLGGGSFTSCESPFSSHYIRGSVGLRADLDAVTMPEIGSQFLSRPAHSWTNFVLNCYVLGAVRAENGLIS